MMHGGMPREEDHSLGAHLIDLSRALIAELYDRLALAGFGDLPTEAASILKDVGRSGSYAADLAERTVTPLEQTRHAAQVLADRGYATFADDHIRLTDRGWAAVEAGQLALAEIERAWAGAVGAERFAEFSEVLRRLTSWNAYGGSGEWAV